MTSVLIGIVAGAALFALAARLRQPAGCNGSSCGACGAACTQSLEVDDDSIR
jgi:hypothetical protein